MTCTHFIELIQPYLDGELTHTLGQSFLWHARQCSRCDAELRAFDQTIALTRRAYDNLLDRNSAKLVHSILAATSL